jgi:hypothetical protein
MPVSEQKIGRIQESGLHNLLFFTPKSHDGHSQAVCFRAKASLENDQQSRGGCAAGLRVSNA